MNYAFTDDVVATLKEMAFRKTNKITADKDGPFMIAKLRQRLIPIREDLRAEINKLLAQQQALEDLKCYLADFWGGHPKGAYFKDSVWNYATRRGRNKRVGRLQITFSIVEGVLRTEYVAYKKTDSSGVFHIENIAEQLKTKRWRRSFYEAAQACKRFTLHCRLRNGESISVSLGKITEADLTGMADVGLDVGDYFTVAMDRPFIDVNHFTVSELAELAVSDWCNLFPLYSLLENGTTSPDRPVIVLSDSVQQTVKKESDADYTPEWGGEYSYTVSDVIKCRKRHASVIQTLRDDLNALGYQANNDYMKDLFIENNGELEVLFEAKTGHGTSSVYSAIGQLYYYSCGLTPLPKLVFVVEEGISDNVVEKLKQLNIEILRYELAESEARPVFKEDLKTFMGSLLQ